jgi:ribose-phosphate pyrophosphokinase
MSGSEAEGGEGILSSAVTTASVMSGDKCMAQPRIYGEIKVFSGSSCGCLTGGVCQHLGLEISPCEIVMFSNENIFVRLGASVRGQDVFIIQTMSSPVNQHLVELLIFIDTVKRASAGRITVVVPYFAYGRSDKKDQPRVPITARLIADLIATAGADRWMTIDLHAGQIQGFFSIPGDEMTAFHIISRHLAEKQLRNAVVVAVDLGFAKKGRNYAAGLRLPMAFIEKRRDPEDAHVEAMTVLGDVNGKNVFLVDDEVDTGESVQQAVTILKQHGAADIYLAFTHAVLSANAAQCLGQLPLREIITTDTIPLPPEKRSHLPHLTILSVGPLLGEVIRRVHEGVSVGAMFNE